METIAKHTVNQAVFQQLRVEKIIMEAKLRRLKVAYISLKEQIQGVVLKLSSTEKQFQIILIRWISWNKRSLRQYKRWAFYCQEKSPKFLGVAGGIEELSWGVPRIFLGKWVSLTLTFYINTHEEKKNKWSLVVQYEAKKDHQFYIHLGLARCRALEYQVWLSNPHVLGFYM